MGPSGADRTQMGPMHTGVSITKKYTLLTTNYTLKGKHVTPFIAAFPRRQFVMNYIQ